MQSSRDKLLGLMKEIAVYHDLRDRNNIYKALMDTGGDAPQENKDVSDGKIDERIDLIYDNLIQRTEGAKSWAPYTPKPVKTDNSEQSSEAESGFAKELNDNIPVNVPGYLKNAFKFVGNWNGRVDGLGKLEKNNFLYHNNVSLGSIIYGSNYPEGLLQSDIDCKGDVSPLNPVVNISDIKASWLQPGVTDTNLVKFFAQGIPTIELSQAVPYFDLKIIDNTKDSVITDGDISRAGEGMSVVKFIKGFGDISETDKQILEAALPQNKIDPDEASTEPGFTPSVAGMELFTLPQTYQGLKRKYVDLNPDGLGGDKVRKNSIIDPFRPLMTVKNFKYNIDTSYVTMPTIRGSLEIVLHDRSRLHEISPLIRPDQNSKQEFLIEFGWSHPRKDTVYGKFLNACRQTRKFIVMSSNYTFESNGHVNISVNLISKGGTTFAKDLPSAAPGSGAVDIFRELNATIKSLQEKLSVDRETTVSLNASFALGKFTSAGDLITVKAKDLKKIQSTVKKFQANASNATELIDKTLEDINEACANVERYRTQVNSAYAKIEGLINAEIVDEDVAPTPRRKNRNNSIHQAHDPWATCWPDVLEVHAGATGSTKAAGFSTKTHISVGRLLSIVCIPVLMKQQQWDQIDFVYYPCNRDSYGLSKFPSIANLPIQKKDFLTQFKLFRQTRAPNPPLVTLVHIILKFVKDYKGNDSGWAIGGALSSVVDSKTGKVSTKYAGNNKAKYSERVTQASLVHYKSPRRVKNPSFKIDVDTVPFKNDKTKSILRVSVMDASNDSYRTYSDLVRSMTSDAAGVLSEALGEDAKGGSTTYTEEVRSAIAKLDKLGYIKEIKKPTSATGENQIALQGKTYKVITGASRIKYFLSTVMPTFKYGTEFTIIKSAAVSSNTDSALGMINLKRNAESADRPAGTEADDSVPFEVLPSTLALTTVGCPFFRHMQQYFFDYQTNTSIDNVYIVTGVEHSISPGTFETSLKLSKVEFYGTFETLSTKLTELQAALMATKEGI